MEPVKKQKIIELYNLNHNIYRTAKLLGKFATEIRPHIMKYAANGELTLKKSSLVPRPLTDRQKQVLEKYTETGSIAETARLTCMSERAARNKIHRLTILGFIKKQK